MNMWWLVALPRVKKEAKTIFTKYRWHLLLLTQATQTFSKPMINQNSYLRLSQNFGYAVLRYFNVAGASPDSLIGEAHNPETHLIPNILLSLLGSGKVFKVFGNDYPTPDGTCVRDYVHVEDLALAHMLCLDVLSEGKAHVYNLGSEKGFSVLEVLKACEKVTARKIPFTIEARRPGDPPTLVASSAKIRRELGWKPKYPDLENIILHAWNWHKKQAKGA